MRLLLCGSLFLLWIQAWLPVCGQTTPYPITKHYLVDTWRLDELLPGSTTTDAVQTPDNYLWFGSFEGALRFDGKRFVLFSPQNTRELPSPWVLALLVDRGGALWLGTQLGPVRVRNGVWEDLHLMKGWQGEPIRSLAQNAAGEVFLGTTSNLFRYRPDRFEKIPIPEGKGKVHLAVDHQDQLWIARENELQLFHNGGWQAIHTLPDPGRIRCIHPSKQGGLWLADTDDIRLWRDGSWVRTHRIPAQFRENLSALCEDRRGCLWAAFFGHGLLAFFPDGQIGRCTIEEGLLNDALRSVFEDNEDNLWVATNGGGVARLKPRRARVYGQPEGLKQDIVNSALAAQNGHQLLVATHGGGVVPFDGTRFGEPLTTPDGNPRNLNWVLSCIQDARGDVWLGTYEKGLFRFKPATNGYDYASTIETSEVRCLFEDSQRRVWVGMIDGLGMLEGNQLHRFSSQLPKGQVLAIAEDASQAIWVNIQGKGIFYTKSADEFTAYCRYQEKDLPRPSCLYGDKSGALWIGYHAGQLARIQGGQETLFTSTNGLPKVHFASLIADDQGNLWAGTDVGIMRLGRPSLDAVPPGSQRRIDFQIFDRSDGLASRQCRREYQPLSGRMADGSLWFATMQGLALMDPRQDFPRQTPTPWIEQITLGDTNSVCLRPGAEARMVVPAGTQRMRVSFTGISLGAGERVVFEYRLEPNDHDWISVNQDRTVALRGLHPGNYLFTVRASHDSSVWSPPVSLPITIAAFFWETASFKVLVALSSLGLSAFLAITVSRRRYQRAMELQGKKHVEEKAFQLESSNRELRQHKMELEEALAKVKTLSGLIPICANCHRIRDDKGFWERVEVYIQQRSDAQFSHGICPKCMEKLYPDLARDIKYD